MEQTFDPSGLTQPNSKDMSMPLGDNEHGDRPALEPDLESASASKNEAADSHDSGQEYQHYTNDTDIGVEEDLAVGVDLGVDIKMADSDELSRHDDSVPITANNLPNPIQNDNNANHTMMFDVESQPEPSHSQLVRDQKHQQMEVNSDLNTVSLLHHRNLHDNANATLQLIDKLKEKKTKK
ncbi:hypothetical protein RFI_22009 [Reticulomyxa filosa]|uniref:Uncharacterized protein n=1 Tax=Reticulomyxa filosa TaxID=46433 RepID=X6MNB8_RETFI|nr:hypothetical protein RFI_22009 [Reticulomyxa filosa]|eukprot:ETO15349.1 hypothetical protein RFI_22009 [Reticulomyxa filosa]